MTAGRIHIVRKGLKPGKRELIFFSFYSLIVRDLNCFSGNFKSIPYIYAGIMKAGFFGFMFIYLLASHKLIAQAQIYSTSGAYTFTVPAGVSSINVQAWGGGGCSGYNGTGRARGGGGGGAFTGGTILVNPGDAITVIVGSGGNYTNNNSANDDGGTSSAAAIVANGGSRGLIGDNVPLNGGSGAVASTDPGGVLSFISHAGGNGGNGYVAGNNGGGGGGGESGSPAADGNPGGNGTSGGAGGAGGTGNAGGGNGGRGSDNNFPNSTDGIDPGGGGGGRGDDEGNNTDGGLGKVIITWTIPICVSPAVYTITGGGSYCSGGPGLLIGLSNSESGVEYQLFRGALPQGSPYAGTASALNFGFHTMVGTYSIVATRLTGGCTAAMNGNVLISIVTIPTQPLAIMGNTPLIQGVTGQAYFISSVSGATTYSWNVPLGWTITGGQGSTSITVNPGLAGQNGNITVTAGNLCGTSIPQQLNVTVIVSPVPYISANYCAGGGNIELTANGGGAGATFLWSTGQTSQNILVNIAGLYSVVITDALGISSNANYNISTELVVNGDFSAGNIGFTHSTYIFEPDIAGNGELGPEGHYGVGTDPQTYHTNFWGRDHTSASGNFMIVNGFPNAPQPVVWATNVAVIPGIAYYFSAWAMSLNSVGNYATLQFRVNNTLVGTTAPLPARPNNNNPPYGWTQFYGTWTAPAGLFSTSIEIVDSQTAANGNDFGLDDISFATLAPLPSQIAPSDDGSILCTDKGQTLNLLAHLTGGKAPYTFSWTGPNGFTSNIANPSIPNVTSLNTGFYILSITDGYGCPAIVASTALITIHALPNCSYTGPPTLCPSSTGNIYSAPAAMSSYVWNISGSGFIVGLTNGQNVNVTAFATGIITLNLTVTDGFGCSSECQQIFTVEDIVPPDFIPPPAKNYCVNNIITADFDGAADINPARPEYYIFPAGSTELDFDPAWFLDNCSTSPSQIRWLITFADGSLLPASPALYLTGQPSAYGSDIIFPGDGFTFLNVVHSITYWVVDDVGLVSQPHTSLITTTPRPNIIKM